MRIQLQVDLGGRKSGLIFFLFGCCFSIHFLFFAYLLNAYASWVLSFPSFLTWYPAWLCSHSHCANPSQPSLLSFKHGTLPFGYLMGISNYHPNFVKVAHSCLTLCDSVDYTVHGILQARIPEWVVMPFSRLSSQPKSHLLQADSLPAEPPGKPSQNTDKQHTVCLKQHTDKKDFPIPLHLSSSSLLLSPVLGQLDHSRRAPESHSQFFFLSSLQLLYFHSLWLCSRWFTQCASQHHTVMYDG